MILADSIKKSFNCIVENPSITLFLVLFLIVTTILYLCIFKASNYILALILILCLFALIFAFCSGWFKIIKESTNIDKIKEKNFYGLFLEGVGEYIFPVTISSIIYTCFIFLTIYLAQFIASKFFGDINSIIGLLGEKENLIQFYNSLNENQKDILLKWDLCLIGSFLIFNFLFMFYFPSVLYSEKKLLLRPFIAIWTNIKFLFKNFFSALGLEIFICFLYIILAILNARFAQNFVISVLLQLIYIYFISYVVMLIFNYYEAKNNSSDGPDCIGENKVIDSVSEEN